MSLLLRSFLGGWFALLLVALGGCYATQPAYFCESGDLNHYLETATEIEYPDVEYQQLDEVAGALPPFTLSHPFENGQFVDLTLEDAVTVALQNSKVIRNLGSIRPSIDGRSIQPDDLLGDPQPGSSTTIYDPSLVETDPFNGVEGALAEFDAQLSSSLFWDRTDRQQNFQNANVFFTFLNQDDVNFDVEISKKSATGTQLFFRNVTTYSHNARVPPRAIPSDYTTALEIEAVQPLLRGRGTQVNRIPVILARINHDISLADFEANVRNLVMDVEQAYWDLHCLYRILDANKRGRDLALETWQRSKDLQQAGESGAEVELRARGQYYAFRSQVEINLRQLYNAENHLRWLMGLAATDGHMLRPVDEPTVSKIVFGWPEIHCEALCRTPELRRQKWVIKQREMELIAARNDLLPDLNATALYRWFGIGNDLIDSSRTGLDFPQPGSNAWESLTGGRFQEFRLGLEFGMPIGFRRALAGVRNAQLGLARERARLEDMELNVSHLLSQSVRDLDGVLVTAQTSFNEWAAYRSEVQLLRKLSEGGEAVQDPATGTDFILRAFQRAVSAEIAYYQAVCDYNKAIAQLHFRKGSLLEYNNIQLAEGPWSKKAYYDALGHARRRSASKYLDYGWTRPDVVSCGPVPQQTGVVVPADQGSPFEVVPPDQLNGLEPIPAQPSEPIDPKADELPGPGTARLPQPIGEATLHVEPQSDTALPLSAPETLSPSPPGPSAEGFVSEFVPAQPVAAPVSHAGSMPSLEPPTAAAISDMPIPAHQAAAPLNPLR